MKNFNKKGFTLVELLVVITILAIISVVAYQNFGGATDKAISSRKINDVSTIESALLQYKVANNFYPTVGVYASNNLWGYTGSQTATPSNKVTVTYDGNKITNIGTTSGGGKVYGSGSVQIGAKGTISRDNLTRQYLSNDLYDPELGDIKVGSNKMIDSGIGRYVYAVYRKSANWGTQNLEGTNFNIAYTIKDSSGEQYTTKIVGDFDQTVCSSSEGCGNTLIGSFSGSSFAGLVDGQKPASPQPTNTSNQGIPYPVTDFTKQ